MTRKHLIISWAIGAVLIAGAFYLAVALLWSAAAESRAASIEAQVISALSADIAEGNLFKLGVTLAKLKRDGIIMAAEIRQLSDSGGSNLVYRTQDLPLAAEESFKLFSCVDGRKLVSRSNNGVDLITALPSNSIGVSCSMLYISANLPPELQRFKSKVTGIFGVLLITLSGLFFWFSMVGYRKILALETKTAMMRIEKDAEIGRLAAQVAHDIRSPLAALDSALKDLSALPAEQQTLARGAMGRIGEIARDLLDNYKKPGARAASTENPAVPHDLKPLIEPVLAEKRAQYSVRPEVTIDFSAEEVRAAVQPAELRRIVSNLVNNAVEAFEKGGRVEVSLSRLDGRVLLKVADDGKGVPPELLAKLGQKGETHGKSGGTGLGLYHARKSAESWGGTLKIDSEPGKGTTITLELPAVPAVKPVPKAAVLLDDDALVHMNWKMAAKAAGVELKPFKSPEELLAAAAAIPKYTPLYIDSDLGDGAKGEDVAVRLRGLGFTDLTMATGHSPEKFSHLPWLKVTGKEPPWA